MRRSDVSNLAFLLSFGALAAGGCVVVSDDSSDDAAGDDDDDDDDADTGDDDDDDDDDDDATGTAGDDDDDDTAGDTAADDTAGDTGADGTAGDTAGDTGADTGGGTGGSDLCAAYGELVDTCFGEGGYYTEIYCNESLAEYAKYSQDCAVAFEEFLACVNELACRDFDPATGCAKELAGYQKICPAQE